MKANQPRIYPSLNAMTYVVPWSKKAGRAAATRFFAKAEHTEDLYCNRTTSGGLLKEYDWSLGVADPNTIHFDVGLLNAQEGVWGVRVHANPSEHEYASSEFSEMLASLMGSTSNGASAKPQIERLNCTVRTEGISLNDLLVHFQHQDWQTFSWRDSVGPGKNNLRIGAVSAQYAPVCLDADGLANPDVLTRMERCGLPVISAEANSFLEARENEVGLACTDFSLNRTYKTPIRDFKNQPNPFADFAMADARAVLKRSNGYLGQSFVAIAREQGVHSALQLSESSAVRKDIRQLWESSVAEWWDPDHCWNSCRSSAENWISMHRDL